jgi:ABC-type phosphate transport system permease subunit
MEHSHHPRKKSFKTKVFRELFLLICAFCVVCIAVVIAFIATIQLPDFNNFEKQKYCKLNKNI